MSNFELAFSALLDNEGLFVDNPNDPGGATKYGVTEKVARKHGYKGDMRDLPQSTARDIAKAEYWDMYQCDLFPLEIGFQVFDAAYNGGHPAQWLQQAAGMPADGVVGPATVRAVLGTDPDKIVMRFDAFRLKYMAALGAWPSFGKGWANRIADNLLRAAV